MDRLMVRHRLGVNLFVHNLLFTLALLAAFLVRYDAGVPAGNADWFRKQFLFYLPFVLMAKSILFYRLGLFQARWRYASIHDLWRIVYACWLFVLMTWVIVLATWYMPQWLLKSGHMPQWIWKPAEPDQPPYNYSKGVIFLDFVGTIFLVGAAKLGARIYQEELRPVSSEGFKKVMIVGAGNAAETLIREISRMTKERYRVIGLVDDDPGRRDLRIHGLPVLGTTEDLKPLCQAHAVDEILIALPQVSQKELRRVIELCRGTNLKFKMTPGVSDLIDGRFTVSQIHEVDINDLLGREAVNLDHQAISRFIAGRRVLVTGAGGSIGSEMARQIAAVGPAELQLLEQAENPLFDIEHELMERFAALRLKPIICDIFDRQRVLTMFDVLRPEVVIHAAAHKHVPLMERNPCEALKNNIFGTRNVVDASCKYGAAEFVMISTDKAVNPSSIMGCSKRVAELYVQASNSRPGCQTQFKAVRFGNVLGSAGSVVPIFKKQIAAGGPVRVTHPEMTRYFMTIPEASQLVLQAAATGRGGQIFLLDMGEPVKIVDLARDLITLSGFRPNEDIEIVFCGVRPGEKLFEELRTGGEDIAPTTHEKVLVWRTVPMDYQEVCRQLDTLEPLLNCSDRTAVVAALKRIVPEYQPLNPPADAGAAKPNPRADAAVIS
jgi:FlaA1/EpsC-like NDP-sugar epimerase